MDKNTEQPKLKKQAPRSFVPIRTFSQRIQENSSSDSSSTLSSEEEDIKENILTNSQRPFDQNNSIKPKEEQKTKTSSFDQNNNIKPKDD